jgi:hypothetical protein
MVSALAEEPAGAEESCSVCVAVKLRPLVASEVSDGCRECMAVDPGTTQVRVAGGACAHLTGCLRRLVTCRKGGHGGARLTKTAWSLHACTPDVSNHPPHALM